MELKRGGKGRAALDASCGDEFFLIQIKQDQIEEEKRRQDKTRVDG